MFFVKDFILRSSAALAVLTVILVQSIHLALAVLAFDKLWHFVDLLTHNPAGRFDAALTVICAIGPLTIALLVSVKRVDGSFADIACIS